MDAWRMRLKVRSYEVDRLGHVNHAVYHQYGELARVGGFEAAGLLWDKMTDSNMGPVLLHTSVDFRRELRVGDEFDVTCEARFTGGKTFHLDTLITKLDGAVSAQVRCLLGVMDLEARKLFPDARHALESAGLDPAVLPSVNFAD
jgi:acyl-CoA thioester hydrolase